MAATIDAALTTSSPKLQLGSRVPTFVLPSTQGGQSGPGAMRSKYNLVLAFVDGSREGEAYLQRVAAVHADILQEQARVLVVVPLSLRDAEMMRARLSLPFTLLADEDGSTTERMLGAGNRAALCVADRFGEVFYIEGAPTAAGLPPPGTALGWLAYIQVQCPE